MRWEEPVLDTAALMRRVEDDLELLQAIGSLFFQAWPGKLAALREAIGCRDVEVVERVAHSVLGSTGNFAAQGAAQAARRLEGMGRSGNLEGADKALAALEAEVERMRGALTALVREAL
jgi:HPt (histidine-containing phosphotransfer) domain-containing protein